MIGSASRMTRDFAEAIGAESGAVRASLTARRWSLCVLTRLLKTRR
jgi:hypothetical protein